VTYLEFAHAIVPWVVVSMVLLLAWDAYEWRLARREHLAARERERALVAARVATWVGRNRKGGR